MSIAITPGVDYFANPDQQPRPYVRFEMRPKEGKDAEGKATLVDEAWALITPAGSKDTLEKPVEDWLRDVKNHADAGRVPANWPHQYRDAFEAWKKGEELPVHGFPIKRWAPLTPSQREAVLRTNTFTVEDLALANDELVGRIGMGGRVLVDMAKAWIEDRKGAGALAGQLETALVRANAAEAANKGLREDITKLEEKIKLLEAAAKK